jgi:hypothetical protein
MPQGVKSAYKSGYIMGQMSKQGEMNEANESSLYREKLDSNVMGENSGEFKQSQDSKTAGTKHTGDLGMIMGSSKSIG